MPMAYERIFIYLWILNTSYTKRQGDNSYNLAQRICQSIQKGKKKKKPMTLQWKGVAKKLEYESLKDGNLSKISDKI